MPFEKMINRLHIVYVKNKKHLMLRIRSDYPKSDLRGRHVGDTIREVRLGIFETAHPPEKRGVGGDSKPAKKRIVKRLNAFTSPEMMVFQLQDHRSCL